MELQPSQYAAALRLIKSTEEALDHLSACMRRKEELSRLRRGIEEVEALLKKIKNEIRLG
jgi:hypothetical protein